MLTPHWVAFHDGDGNSYPFLVTQHGADEHVGGAVLCVGDPSEGGMNSAGLSNGWNTRVHIGRGDVTKGASWSPIESAEDDETSDADDDGGA